jgi:hypothetical protein
MAKAKQTSQSTETAATGDLGVLIDAERQLESRLDDVHGEAKRIVAAAQAAAREAEQQLDAELRETTKNLRAEMAAEQKQKLAEISLDFERQATSYDATPEEKIEELGAKISLLLLTPAAEPEGEAAEAPT